MSKAKFNVIKLDNWISVKDFGALGDGATDDTAAFQASLTAIVTAGGGRLWLPRGDYLVTPGTLSISGVAITIAGDGIGKSRIISKTGTGVILTLTQTDYNNEILLTDFSVITYLAEQHTGIVVNGNVTDSTNNRVQERFEMGRLEVRGHDITVHGPLKGFVLNVLHQMTVYSCTASGRKSANGRAGMTNMVAGFEITGSATGIPADFTFNGCHANHSQNGFRFTGGMEGINFAQCYAIACDYGYVSDQTGAGARPWASFIGCHAYVFLYGIRLISMPQSFIVNCLIYKGAESNSLTYAIYMDSCDLTRVHDNTLFNTATNFTTQGDFVGVFSTGTTTAPYIHHNTMDRGRYGVWISGGTNNAKSEGNQLITLFGTVPQAEYLHDSSASTNKRINNPQWESSSRYTGAGLTLNATAQDIVLLALDSAEIGDEYQITALVYTLKDATAGTLKCFVAKSLGTAVATFENTNTSGAGSTYLPASTDGYVTIASRMKIATAGTLTLSLSGVVTAGTTPIATNNAQITITRK